MAVVHLCAAVFDFGTSIYYRVSLVEQNKSFAAHLGGFILGKCLGWLGVQLGSWIDDNFCKFIYHC